MIKQLSVVVEDETGGLARVTRVLSQANINIRAISAFDSPDYSILRLIVDRPEEAKEALRCGGFSVTTADVLAVELKDQPGDLDRMLRILADAGISIRYIYSFVLRKKDEPLMVLNVNQSAEAEKVLEKNNITVVNAV